MRERIVYPRREILSNDVNSITEYNSYNDEIIVRDLLGVSSGIVNGLNISTSVLTATISSGNISFGNGRFNELLTSSSITLPNSNGTYYIYAYKSTTTDTASSGYVLLDVSTRLEDYDVVNSRTYDSIGLNYGASTPSSGIVLYSAVVSGGSITSTVDLRNYVTFGNITAYSLQEFYETNKNGITLSASTSGIIINGANSADYGIAFNNVKRSIDITQQPDSHGIYIKKTADGTTNTTNSAIKTELRQNSIGYIAESIVSGAGNVMGFYSTTSGGNTNIGFASDNANIGFNAVNSFNGAVGLNVVGYALGTNDAGFLQIGGGTAIQVFSTNAYSIYMSQETNPNVGVGIELRKFNDAINIVGLNSTDSGINITNSGLGLSITNNNQIALQKSIVVNTSGSVANNYGVAIDVKRSGVGQLIGFTNSGASDNILGLQISNDSSQNIGTALLIEGTNTFDYGIYITDTDNGLYIQQVADSNNIVLSKSSSGSVATNNTLIKGTITNNAIGLMLLQNATSSSDAIGIYGAKSSSANFESFIVAQDYEVGVSLQNSTTTSKAIQIQGLNTNDFGIYITSGNVGQAIVNPISYGLQIVNTNFSNSPIGIHLDDVYQSILVDGTAQEGIRIKSSVVQQLIIEPKASLTSTADGQIAVYDNGAALKFRFYDDTYTNSWIDLN